MGLFPGAVPLNIDANEIYEDSLRAIKTAAGGDFQIAAITDRDGEAEFIMAVHPYWSSLRSQDDSYWSRLNNQISATRLVPTMKLDSLCGRLASVPPYLIKLDVQGAELAALRGAEAVLKNTHVLICEADVDDFQEINRFLIQNDFVLYDITEVQRMADGTLAWFYPVYVHRALDHVRPKEFWNKQDNDAVLDVQVRRRASILKRNAEIVAGINANRASPKKSAGLEQLKKRIGRNDPCPCGSGKRYKHCCGAYV
jgi:FkbM family methyltransferase